MSFSSHVCVTIVYRKDLLSTYNLLGTLQTKLKILKYVQEFNTCRNSLEIIYKLSTY